MRKKIILISVTAGFVLSGILCYKSWIITFVITMCLSGRTDGRQGIVRSVIIPWRNYRLHLHHWFLTLIVGVVVTARGFHVLTPQISYGFLSAVIFQGIYCYRDWYRIMRKESILPTLAQPGLLAAGNDSGLRTITTEDIRDNSVQLCEEPQIEFCMR